MQKSFHPYAIFDHKRQTVGRFLGVISFILGPILSGLIIDLKTISNFEFIGGFILSSSIIYIVLHWLFDNVVWKFSVVGKTLSIPDYSGEWDVEGETIDDEGEVRFNWEANMKITQKWDAISIQLKTNQSQSYSYTANTLKLPDGRWQISYSYSNQPEMNQLKELRSHKGFCELVFDLKKGVATGHYFNSMGRRTNGNMALKKIMGGK